jgi:uncharacterized protein YgbK (DUF1537 family)
MTQMRRIAIIADDLTGAADTGVQFCPYFEDTLLIAYDQITPEYADISTFSSQALAIYTNTRSCDADSARQRLADMTPLLKEMQLDWVYKKVDSCLRGNIGAETEALMLELGCDVSFIAPAFPAMGRTTVDDIHRVHGRPVDRTEIGRDPVTPVTDSRLSRVVASQSRYAAGHVGLALIQGPEAELHAKIEQLIDNGVRHVVFDVTSQQHLDRIARMMFSLPYKVLAVGSAGLAAGMGFALTRKAADQDHAKIKAAAGNYLLVCGSASDVTAGQVAELVSTYPYKVIALSTGLLADSRRRSALLSRADSARLVLAKNDMILRIDFLSKEDGPHAGKNRSSDPGLLVEGLGCFTAAVMKAWKPAGLFLTGGDTANAVLRALDATGIHISGEIVTGMVAGKIAGGPLSGLAVATKAGAFGRRNTLIQLHQYWKQNLEQES